MKKLVSEKSDWVPSSILQPAEGDSNNIIKSSNAGNRENVLLVWVFFSILKKDVMVKKKKVIKRALSVLKCSPECMFVLQSLVTWLSSPEIWCLGVRASQAQQLSLA